MISAEGVGKLPHTNIAESLARLPGVTVDHQFGECEQLLVAGVEPALNRLTIDGQTVASADWGGNPLIDQAVRSTIRCSRRPSSVRRSSTRRPKRGCRKARLQGQRPADADRCPPAFLGSARGDYGWLTPAEGGLYRPFQPDALATQIYACGVNGTVLVQAAPTEAETDYLLAVARTMPWVLGVIGWIDFDPADVRAQIAARSEDMLFVGVRPMLQDMADRRWIVEDRHILSFAALANARKTFDALIRADQIDAIAELAEYRPNLSIVVDHAGESAITANGPDHHWIDGSARLAARANVACKAKRRAVRMPG